MRTVWLCDKCHDATFDTEEEAVEHERTCTKPDVYATVRKLHPSCQGCIDQGLPVNDRVIAIRLASLATLLSGANRRLVELIEDRKQWVEAVFGSFETIGAAERATLDLVRQLKDAKAREARHWECWRVIVPRLKLTRDGFNKTVSVKDLDGICAMLGVEHE